MTELCYYCCQYNSYTNQVTAQSKAYVCSHSIGGIAGSNQAQGMDVHLSCLLCCVRSGLCDGLIILSEESHHLCVCM